MLRDIALEAFEDVERIRQPRGRRGNRRSANARPDRQERDARDRRGPRALTNRRCAHARLGRATRRSRSGAHARSGVVARARRPLGTAGGRDEQRFQGQRGGRCRRDRRRPAGAGSDHRARRKTRAPSSALAPSCVRPRSRRRATPQKPPQRPWRRSSPLLQRSSNPRSTRPRLRTATRWPPPWNQKKRSPRRPWSVSAQEEEAAERARLQAQADAEAHEARALESERRQARIERTRGRGSAKRWRMRILPPRGNAWRIVAREWRDLSTGIDVNADLQARYQRARRGACDARERARARPMPERVARRWDASSICSPASIRCRRSADLSLKAAERALRDVRTALAAVPQLPTKQDFEEVTRRLKATQAALVPKVQELREADDWKRFANASIQEQLCAKMEALQVGRGSGSDQPRRCASCSSSGAKLPMCRARRPTRYGAASRPRTMKSGPVRSALCRPGPGARREPREEAGALRAGRIARRLDSVDSNRRRNQEAASRVENASARCRAAKKKRSGTGSVRPAIDFSPAATKTSPQRKVVWAREPREEGRVVRARRSARRIDRLGSGRRRDQEAPGRVAGHRTGEEEQVRGGLAPVPRRVRPILCPLRRAPRHGPRRARGSPRSDLRDARGADAAATRRLRILPRPCARCAAVGSRRSRRAGSIRIARARSISVSRRRLRQWWPAGRAAFAGSDLDPDANRKRMETLVRKDGGSRGVAGGSSCRRSVAVADESAGGDAEGCARRQHHWRQGRRRGAAFGRQPKTCGRRSRPGRGSDRCPKMRDGSCRSDSSARRASNQRARAAGRPAITQVLGSRFWSSRMGSRLVLRSASEPGRSSIRTQHLSPAPEPYGSHCSSSLSSWSWKYPTGIVPCFMNAGGTPSRRTCRRALSRLPRAAQ